MELDSEVWEGVLHYDEDSPTFLRWRVSPARHIKAGSVAGHINKISGYIELRYKGKLYKGHRIVLTLFGYDVTEDLDVDHRDGIKTNNNISNLRLVSREINMRNRGITSANKTGVVGVQYDGHRDRYIAMRYPLGSKVAKRKYFHVGVHGEDAFNLACSFRRKAMEQLVADGAGYTNRHLQLNEDKL